ncbi:MAG: hypothetical protein H6551_07680 [Chitinophagales bacterium]|nr:hypothetical protein [Chitinophagaceae bacterium]MCB9065010.1 hypothetical protein [Chitinophagales bacterium]
MQIPKEYKVSFYSALAIFILTALFSTGYHHFDEHYQIMEFCNYKMGYSPASELAWEYHAQIRPGLQPFIAYCFANVLNGLGIYNPFLLTTLLRLMMAILSWWAISKLILQLLSDFTTSRGKMLFVLSGFLLWYVPYVSVRFSAEAFSSVFFLLACSQILKQERTGKNVLLAGLLLGVAWVARIQLGFAFVGIGIWMLMNKWSLKHWFLMGMAFVLAVAACSIPDYWLYDTWTLVPYNYFNENILHSKAASFGEMPWWGYFEMFLMNGVPPISILLLILFFRGIWQKPKHLFSLACITFFLGHFAIGHKEMRFLFPLSFPFGYLVAVGIEAFIQGFQSKKFYRIGFKVLIIMNILLLLYAAFHPAQDTIQYYKYMYKSANKGTVTLICLNESPYNRVTLESNFYKHTNLNIIVLDNLEQLSDTLDAIHTDEVYYFSPRQVDKETVEKYNMERVYSSLPDWLLKFNFNNWQERTKVGTIYRLI